VYTCIREREGERALRAAKLNCNNYLFISFGLLITVNVLRYLCVLLSLLDSLYISVEEGFQALTERRAQIMNARCNLLIFPVVYSSSFCF
jgi:hypothetical protein